MSCCRIGGNPPHSAAPAVIAPARWPRRTVALIKWALPLTTLALIPKCPACIAGYVFLFTGIGVSLPTANAVRWALIALVIAALGVTGLALRQSPRPSNASASVQRRPSSRERS